VVLAVSMRQEASSAIIRKAEPLTSARPGQLIIRTGVVLRHWDRPHTVGQVLQSVPLLIRHSTSQSISVLQ